MSFDNKKDMTVSKKSKPLQNHCIYNLFIAEIQAFLVWTLCPNDGNPILK